MNQAFQEESVTQNDQNVKQLLLLEEYFWLNKFPNLAQLTFVVDVIMKCRSGKLLKS